MHSTIDKNRCITCDGYWLVDPLNDGGGSVGGGNDGGAWFGCEPFIATGWLGGCVGNGGGAYDVGLLFIAIGGLLLPGGAFVGWCVTGIIPGLPGYVDCGCGGKFPNCCCWSETGGEICEGGAFCAEKSLFNDRPAIWFGKLYKCDTDFIPINSVFRKIIIFICFSYWYYIRRQLISIVVWLWQWWWCLKIWSWLIVVGIHFGSIN